MRGGYGINNTPRISNGFGFGGTLGYNGNIALNSGIHSLPYPEAPHHVSARSLSEFHWNLAEQEPHARQRDDMCDWFPATAAALPYVQNWNFGFQYQFPAAMVLEVNYIGNKGTRLIAKGYSNPNAVPFSASSSMEISFHGPGPPASPIPARTRVSRGPISRRCGPSRSSPGSSGQDSGEPGNLELQCVPVATDASFPQWLSRCW